MEIKIIDKLEPNHVKKLHILYRHEKWTQNRSQKDVERMLKHCDFVFGLCSEDNDELIGFARVVTDHVYKAFIFDVIIDPSYRNRGFGALIIDTIFNHPTLSGVAHVELYCPEDIVPFYEKLGFKRRTSLLLRKTNHG